MLSKTLKFISAVALPEIIVIGLDIHERNIAAVARASVYGRSATIASAVYDLPEGVIENGELKDPSAFKTTIETFLRMIPSGKVGSSNEPIFILSVPPNHIYTETATFPSMDDIDIADSVRLKMETSMPWPVAESYVDWNLLTLGDAANTGVFIAGASKAVLDQYFKVFLENNWKLGACEFHLFSLARIVRDEESKPFIFILRGEHGVEFAAFAGGSIVSHYFDRGAPDDAVIESKVRQIASHVESTFGFKIEKVVVFDKAGMERASADLSSVVGIPARTFVPSDGAAEIDPRAFIAYAASERPYSSGAPLLNLMPPALGGRYEENLFEKTVGLWAKIATLAIGIFLLAIGGVYAVLSWEEGNLRANIATFQPALQAQEAKAMPLIIDAEAFNRLVDSVSEVKARRTDIGSRLQAIQTAMTNNGISFVGARSNGAGGVILTFSASVRRAALDFQTALQKDTLFSAVSIPLEQLAPDTDLKITALISK